MEITRRLPEELQPLDSDLTAVESRPFKPWGDPKWTLALSSKQVLFNRGQG